MTVLPEIIALALRWRYGQFDHPASTSPDQQSEDGLELLRILQEHGINVPREYAATTIPAPMNAVRPNPLTYMAPLSLNYTERAET